MTTFIQVLSLLVLMIVAGCQPAADATSFSTSKPRTLSRISDSVLSVRVTIDGTRHYDGRPRADGNWVIQPLGLELGVDHTVLIKWYGEYEDQTYLLVTQEGSFYADPESTQAVLNLPEISSGSPEYDSDCDDQTNLDEFRAGSDPGTLPGCNSEPGPGPSPGPVPEPESGTGLAAWVVHHFYPFALTGFILPVTAVDLPVQAKSFNTANGVAFGLSLPTSLDLAATDKLSLNLLSNEQGQKFVEISIFPAVNTQGVTGGTCYEGADDNTRLACSIPFDWQLDHWYTLRVTISPTNGVSETSLWDGWIVDQETGETFPVGTIEAANDITLQWASPGIGYFALFDQTDCTEGLPPSTFNYLAPVVNDIDFSPIPVELQASPCAANGGGASADDSMTNEANEVVFSLTLGR